MQLITLAEIAHATAGKLLAGNPALTLREISTDTRKLPAGCLFIAIKGENFDGHSFLPDAAQAGAAAALVHSPPAALPAGLALVQVDDTRLGMGRLASYIRSHFRGRVIGIGGSNGKTSTKHLVDSVLKQRFRGTRSDKSFNNEIGVPLTLFAAGEQDDYVVVEMGTNHAGEMRVLTRIAQPDIGIIMNAAPEHLEGLGSLDGVRQEEASLVEGLKPAGLLIVNGDDDDLLRYASSYQGRRVTFGWRPTCDLFATDVRCDLGGTRFLVNGQWEAQVPLAGRHFAVNALAAIAAGRELGLTARDIAAGLAAASSPDMRMQLSRLGGLTILNDAYNANPASMSAALATLAALDVPGRRVAILGGMRELGPHSAQLHRDLGAEVAQTKEIDLLITVGDLAKDIATGARAAGMQEVQELESSEAAKAILPPLLQPTDTLLLKGSRGVRVEKVLEALDR
jgi:UDP-N-acetylmuramoyl-tripeptide--D-alanyl-D-alanine ligase